MDSRTLWQTVLGELEVSVSRANFRTWFKDTAIISQDDGRIVVAVPNPITKSWLENKFSSDIKHSLDRMGLAIKSLEFRIASVRPAQVQSSVKDPLIAAVTSAPSVSPQPVHRKPAAHPATPNQTRAPFVAGVIHPQLNPRYTFDNFVVGSSNELAYAAAQAVCRYPGEKYNPLFIYGGVGLGKTHLMQAIGNEILRHNPSAQVRYVTCEQLTNEFVASLQSKKTKRFADLYRNLDVLIVDDIQFLGNKEKTQEEFFHTFNALHQAGKQIIMSSDKPPKAIPHLEDRLRSRFEMGMTADIQRPDLETRSAIIQRKAATTGARLPLDLVDYLARHVQHNIRELEGALTQLIAYCELHSIEPSLTIIKGLLGGRVTGGGRTKTITPKAILDKTAAYFDLQPSDITGSRRDRDIVVPRQIAMYLMRRDLGLSYPRIAAAVGGRDHTTAMHSVTKIEKMLEVDEDLQHEVNRVRERVSL